LFNGKDIVTQLFLAPRGLITILLFFAIPERLSIGPEFQGVLLFVILISCLIMTWSMISSKNKIAQIGEREEEDLLEGENIEEEEVSL
jgi:NhaP-type Na+/H+ or K+/H+ antiporter